MGVRSRGMAEALSERAIDASAPSGVIFRQDALPDSAPLVDELDRRRRAGNARALSIGFSVINGAVALALFLAGIDARVVVVALCASACCAGCAWMAGKGKGDVAAWTLNAVLAAVLFAGVAVNRQIGPGPAFVGFSLFVAAATLTLRGVVVAGVVGALSVAGMSNVARGEPQLA